MRTIHIFLLAVCTLALGMTKPGTEHQELQENLKLLETWIEAQMEYRGMPGLSVGIVHDQELVYANGFGYADLEKKVPATPETVYRIASITKTFTATALIQLRDADKLRLDDPVEDYLDWFDIENPFDGAPQVTIRQLITHTSGLPREAAFPYWTDHKFPTREQVIETLPDQEMVYPPETKIKYSNLGLTLAGEVVAAASGLPYEDYIHSQILEPLGMRSSAVTPDADLMERMAIPYSRRFADGSRIPMTVDDTQGITPAANMVSTVQDMARYLSLQFREDENVEYSILKGSSLKDMHRVHFLRSHWRSGWGLGFSIWYRKGETVCGHGGWVAGMRSQIMFVPENRIGVVVMTNADDGEPAYFARHILDFIQSHLPAEEIEEIKPDESWLAFVGEYRDPWWFETQVMILGDKLVMNTYSFPPEDELDSELIELTPVSPNTFRMTGDNGNGELVVFELDTEGRVNQIKMGENFLYPADKVPFPGE